MSNDNGMADAQSAKNEPKMPVYNDVSAREPVTTPKFTPVIMLMLALFAAATPARAEDPYWQMRREQQVREDMAAQQRQIDQMRQDMERQRREAEQDARMREIK